MLRLAQLHSSLHLSLAQYQTLFAYYFDRSAHSRLIDLMNMDALADDLNAGLLDEQEQLGNVVADAVKDTKVDTTVNAGTAAAAKTEKPTAAQSKSADDVLAGLGL